MNIEKEKAMWNQRAKEFHASRQWKERQGQVEHFYRYVVSHDLLRFGETVLDVGCGTGDYIKHFAQEGHHCVGTDISEEMLAYATTSEDPRLSWVCGAFDTSLVEKHKWKGAFDFAFSTYSPAMNDDGIYLLNEVARRSNLVLTFASRTDSGYDEISKIFLPKDKARDWEAKYNYLIASIKDLGYAPHIEFTEQVHEEELTIRAGAEYFASRLMGHLDTPYTRLVIEVEKVLLKKYGVYDAKHTFINKTVGKTAWVYWRKD